MQPENPLPPPSRGPTGVVPQGTPQQNPKVVQPQVDQSAIPAGQPHLETLPPSKRTRSMVALISLIAIIVVAVALFIVLF